VKKFKLLTVLLASALVVSACSSSSDDAGGSGGAITVAYQNDIATLDPAIGYDWQNWSIIKSLFSRLLDYEPGTTNLVPDLATEMPKISADGMTFEFNMRDDVNFHNGRLLVADDVKYSIERAVNPKTQSPGAGFFASIEGFDDASA
jgi:ABC-type transport system substrate-binding protein